jgi:wyosine [tRNA(Phe)-imidazoG37] synthetase (radical SAM superfamily)
MAKREPERERHVYGPVLSRRLGISLGVDLVPYKTCDYDCVYCQLGRTTRHTAVRSEFHSPSVILDELKLKLDLGEKLDYITLSGSGEPTLNSSLGIVTSGIKELTDIPLAILTNGSLLSDEQVAADCALADLVIPSLDAGDEETFQKVNRPVEGLTLEHIVDGMESFRARYPGQMWLEVMLVSGTNTRNEQIEKIRSLTEQVNPDRVQLNTVVRPPAEAGAMPLDEGILSGIAKLFGAKTEVVTCSCGTHDAGNIEADVGEILELLARRPCTAVEVSSTLEVHPAIALEVLWRMIGEGILTTRSTDLGTYYTRAV